MTNLTEFEEWAVNNSAYERDELLYILRNEPESFAARATEVSWRFSRLQAEIVKSWANKATQAFLCALWVGIALFAIKNRALWLP